MAFCDSSGEVFRVARGIGWPAGSTLEPAGRLMLTSFPCELRGMLVLQATKRNRAKIHIGRNLHAATVDCGRYGERSGVQVRHYEL